MANDQDPTGPAPLRGRREGGRRPPATTSARSCARSPSSTPRPQTQLFGADGQLNRYVNVYLNDEDVRVLDGLDTGVGECDTLVILPAMAGGVGRRATPGERVSPAGLRLRRLRLQPSATLRACQASGSEAPPAAFGDVTFVRTNDQRIPT